MSDKQQNIRDRAGEIVDQARERATEVAGTARERAIEAYDSARDNVREARKGARKQVEASPLAALGGGLAIGAIIAALLPKTRKEKELFGPLTDRVKETAKEAAEAARTAGQGRLDELGLTKTAGTDAIKKVVEGATDAIKTSAKAAASAVKEKK